LTFQANKNPRRVSGVLIFWAGGGLVNHITGRIRLNQIADTAAFRTIFRNQTVINANLEFQAFPALFAFPAVEFNF